MDKTCIKLGVMQPYFVPYIGYWQLMNLVDKYVIYDDVNYINRGWINRNRILLNGEPHYLNIPMIGASQNKLINEIYVNNDDKLLKKNLKMIESAYSKAPYFKETYHIIEKILRCDKSNLAEYISYSIRVICGYLDIKTELIISSQINKDNNLKGQDKIIEICKILNVKEYYNAIGGKELYDRESFRKNGIELKFLKTNEIRYKQFNNEFQSNLSILDIMMFNDKDSIKDLLTQYELE